MAKIEGALGALSRARLLELAREFGISGLTTKQKDEIIEALARAQGVKPIDLLATLNRSELKDICRDLGLDDSGKEKAAIIARIMEHKETGLDFSAEKEKEKNFYHEDTKNTKKKENKVSDDAGSGKRKSIEQYEHKDKERLNNPPVGLVDAESDKDEGKKEYAFDPHLDPQLVWAGKAERMSFTVPTVSLHVHERIDPKTIIEAVRKKNGTPQGSFFSMWEENPPLREAIEFYQHPHGWSNRLVAGDSLQVMNSLLEKEGMAGKVQMIYLDPPYGIKYGSNFQPFVNKRDVKDGKDDDLTQEPEQIRAFRDTWELGIHSYLSYLRDRLLLAKELLTESGSVFVQISDENVHHVREVMDEVFGIVNFISQIYFATTSGFATSVLSRVGDYLVCYAKDRAKLKYRQLFFEKGNFSTGDEAYKYLELKNGIRRPMTREEREGSVTIPKGARIYRLGDLQSQGAASEDTPFEFEGKAFRPKPASHWKANYPNGMELLKKAKRIEFSGNNLNYVRFIDDYPVIPINNSWMDTGFAGFATDKRYVVETNAKVIARCLLMTTDPGDLVFDPTCGSGTTAYVAEQWGRRWITCDTSRVAIALAKQRLMTAPFDYYELARPDEGVGSGFKYKTVPHVTLKSIANNEPPGQETLYDQPLVDRKKVRVTGPFTVEAVPSPVVQGLEEWTVGRGQGSVGSGQGSVASGQGLGTEHRPLATTSIARSGETARQSDWRDELLNSGIRAKGGRMIEFSRVEALSGTRWLHADAETKGAEPERVVVSFGPMHAPLEQRQVELAIEEARKLVPKPKIIVFASFHFDPEAAKDIDETEWPGVMLLKVQMNTDLLTEDLKKKRSSNESFWLVGQPDVAVVSEQWLVDSGKRRVMPYEFCQELSGLDSLAKINGIDQRDLQLYAALAQRRDLWSDLAGAAGGGLDPGQHRGRPGPAGDGGVQTISGDRPGLVGRIGDAVALVRRLGLSEGRRRQELVKRLRGNRALVEWAVALPLSKPLTTAHYSQVTVQGFDYYNPVTGMIESGGSDKIAMWMLDTDYDGRSLFPRQFFFPMAGEKEGWSRLARNLKAEIDEELIEAYRGTVSLPFEAGEHKRAAVKIVDDRGIESLKIIGIE